MFEYCCKYGLINHRYCGIILIQLIPHLQVATLYTWYRAPRFGYTKIKSNFILTIIKSCHSVGSLVSGSVSRYFWHNASFSNLFFSFITIGKNFKLKCFNLLYITLKHVAWLGFSKQVGIPFLTNNVVSSVQNHLFSIN